MGDAGTMSVAASNNLTTTGVQAVTGAKTFSNQKLVLRNPADTFSLTVTNPAITANSDLILNQTYTFYICKISTTFYVKSGDLGGAIVHSGSNAATEIQWAIDNVPTSSGGTTISGGLIVLAPNTVFDLGSTGTAGITIENNKTRYTNLIGSGVTTLIKWTGTGPAIKIVNTLAPSSFPRYRIGNFAMIGENIAWDGSSNTRTSGRNGIEIVGTGGTFELTHIWARNFADLIVINSVEFSDINNIIGKILNNGIKIYGSSTINTCSGHDIHNLSLSSIWENGIWYNASDVSTAGAETCHMHDLVIDDFVQSAIRVDSYVNNICIGPNIYTEGISSTEEATYGSESLAHFVLKGISTAPLENVTIQHIHFGGVENTDNAIVLEYCKDVELVHCDAKGFRKALVLINANTGNTNMRIRHPKLRAYSAGGSQSFTGTVTPYLIDTPSDSFLTTTDARIAGTVETSRATGIIVMAAIATGGVIAGDVVTWAAGGGLIGTIAVADTVRPAVIMFPNSSTNRPAVIAIKGIAKVNMDGATTYHDTITTSATTKKGRVNNNATDAKLILGYSIGNIASAGLADVQIK